MNMPRGNSAQTSSWECKLDINPKSLINYLFVLRLEHTVLLLPDSRIHICRSPHSYRFPQTPPSNYNDGCGQSDQTLASLTVGKGEIFHCVLMLGLIILL